MAPCVTVERERNSVRNDNPNEEIFPCNHPVNDHMRNILDRQATFDSWPANIAATNERMAQAGLFYTGIGDRTKCFYCNGGLQSWLRDDDPMEEHAKWFPQCEYVLQKRGVEFVSSISSKFPGLNRPPMPRVSYSPNTRNVVTISNTSIIFPGATNVSYNDIPPHRSSRQNNLENALQHELTNNMRSLGYDEDLLRKVIVRRLQSLHMFDNAFDFLDAIKAMQDELKTSANRPAVSPSSSGQTEDQVPISERNVEIRIKEIEEERRCKVCLDHESDCVFYPCGHLCSCMECASRLGSCPMCRKQISNVVKINLA